MMQSNFEIVADDRLVRAKGKVVIRMALTALLDAPLGSQHIPLKLRYQACSTEACLPPVTLPVDASINLAASSAASRPKHPELFPPQH